MRPPAADRELVETLRRLSNLVRYGSVAKSDPRRGRVRVAYARGPGGDPVLTAWLPFAAAMAGEDSSWRLPSVGEKVAILSPDGEIASGFVLAGFATGDFPAPDASESKHVLAYRDGARISYDAENHVLDATLPDGGSASIEAPDGVTIDGDVVIEGGLTINGDVGIAGGATATGTIAADGKISSRAGIADQLGDMQEMRTTYNGHLHGVPPGFVTPPVAPGNLMT